VWLKGPVPQHAWFRPPQAPQDPAAEQVPGVVPQALPTPTHDAGVPDTSDATQQLPSVHLFPPQQGVAVTPVLAVPHFRQRPLRVHTASASLHF